MDLNLFSYMNELSHPEHIFDKFCDDGLNLSYQKCKQALYFCFGKKIKIKAIKSIIEGRIEGLEKTNEGISKENFEFLFKYIWSRFDLNLIGNHDLILTFYEFLKNQNTLPNLVVFKEKIKLFFPNLSNSYIEEIFLLLDKDKDGLLKIFDLENKLNNI